MKKLVYFGHMRLPMWIIREGDGAPRMQIAKDSDEFKVWESHMHRMREIAEHMEAPGVKGDERKMLFWRGMMSTLLEDIAAVGPMWTGPEEFDA